MTATKEIWNAARQVGRHGYLTRKAADSDRASLAALYPTHTYEIRVRIGGKFIIICTA